MTQQSHPQFLALDTSTEACSAAIQLQGEIDSQFELAPREHTQRILPMVAALLQRHDCQLAQLDAIVCCRGPGSFTGVRIGIGIAQGLAYGAKLPLIGVSSLACLAQRAWRQHGITRVLAAIDARMGEVYWAEYQRDNQGRWQGEASEQVITPTQAISRMQQLSGEWGMAGTGWQAYPQLLEGHDLQLMASDALLPTAEDMLPLATTGWQQQGGVAAAEIEPIYLRNQVTWKKLPVK